jgi:hypothetical protein
VLPQRTPPDPGKVEDDQIGDIVITAGLGTAARAAASLFEIGYDALSSLISNTAREVIGEQTLTRTVAKNIATRPYINSPLTISEIQATGAGVPDAYIPGAFRYDVPGSFNGSYGNYELVIHPEQNTIYHFLFTSH